MGGKTPAQTTANLVAALFEHDSARPDKETGYAAPQLHTHAVIFNLNQLENGQIKPIQSSFAYLKELCVASMVQWLSTGGAGSTDEVLLAQTEAFRGQMNLMKKKKSA